MKEFISQLIKKHTRLSKSTLKVLIPAIVIIVLVSYAAYWASNLPEGNIKLQSPIQNFIRIEPTASSSLIKKAYAAELKPEQMTTEQYICWKFGKDCKMALAISQAENGTRQCDRFNVNTNKTVDYGVFMINTVHLKKGWKIAELIDCHTNIDYAYEIYKSQGWSPWVVFNTGDYKKFLNQ